MRAVAHQEPKVANGPEIRVSDDHIIVRYRATDTMDDEAVARSVCRDVDAVLRTSALRRVLFDTREAANPSEAARDVYWRWVQAGACHDRVALLVTSPLKQVRGNMTARALHAAVRSFHDEADALAWLRGA